MTEAAAPSTEKPGYLEKFKKRAQGQLGNSGTKEGTPAATPVAEAAAKAKAGRFQRADLAEDSPERGAAWIDMDASPPLTVFFQPGVDPNDEFEDPNPVALQRKAQEEAEAKRQEAEVAAKAAAAAEKKAAKEATKAAKKAAKAPAASKGGRKAKGTEAPAPGPTEGSTGETSAPAAAARPSDGIPAANRTVERSDNGPADATMYRHVARIREAMSKKDEAVAALRSRRKDAKNDGLDLAILDRVMGEMKEDPDIIIDRDNELMRYRKAFKIPAYEPIPLESAGRATEEAVVAHAELEGERAGLRAADVNTNPHDPATPAGQAWMKGYNASQEKLRAVLGKKLAGLG